MTDTTRADAVSDGLTIEQLQWTTDCVTAIFDIIARDHFNPDDAIDIANEVRSLAVRLQQCRTLAAVQAQQASPDPCGHGWHWGAKCDEPVKPEAGPMRDTESASGVQALGSSGLVTSPQPASARPDVRTLAEATLDYYWPVMQSAVAPANQAHLKAQVFCALELIAREALSRVPAPAVSEPEWWTVEAKAPPRHARHIVKRDGLTFIGTPCYGTHEPWWVPMSPTGEAEPINMLPTDEWQPLQHARASQGEQP
jgi:hypothetical protein